MRLLTLLLVCFMTLPAYAVDVCACKGNKNRAVNVMREWAALPMPVWAVLRMPAWAAPVMPVWVAPGIRALA